jgi:LDH2 family malate/lactate/ureidoglycolate dehydrogenase
MDLSATQLEEFTARVFAACGLRSEEAKTAAAALVYADRQGLSTHGIANLERIYVRKLLCGEIDAAARWQVIANGEATAVIDARRALGLVVGTSAVDLAIEKAHAFGVGAVAVRGSTHFGPAGYYATRALDRGCIGIAMSNLGAQAIAPPPGGTVKMIGTNPLSVAVPARTEAPFVLDMSTTVVSTGKVRAAARQGRAIPEGWLVDDNGAPVTDPRALDDGRAFLTLLGGRPETGAYKGLGLALLVDILAGVLAGADVGPDPRLLEGERGKLDSNIGHFFLAIDIARFRPLDTFGAAMDRMLGTLLACPSRTGGVSYPGVAEHARRRAATICIEPEHAAMLCELADRFHLQAPVHRSEGEQSCA